MRTRTAALLVVCVLAAAAPAARASGFVTERPPQLVALADGVEIVPLVTAGDVVGRYQMSGVPDGIGAYRSSPSTIEVLVNHELALADDDPSDARISHLTLNNAGGVLEGRYPIDGSEGFEEFCSSTLTRLDGVPVYFTGEEAPDSARMGTSIALHPGSGIRVETPHFGHMFHENVVPLKDMDRAAVFIAEDGAPLKSQIWVYTADTFTGTVLGRGALRVFVPTSPTDADPSPDDIAKGASIEGRLVAVPQSKNRTPHTLELAAQAAGAMDFIRIEDATAVPGEPGAVYFADTGAGTLTSGQETTKGRIYRFEIDPSRPTRARLEVVLDGDADDDMVNPDNLGISDRALVIQEDRNIAKSGYNRVLVYDLGDGSLTPVARTDPRPIAIKRAGGPGAWESSGAVDASRFFGRGWWLLDVQAGDVSVPVPGPSLEPDSAEGEGGQLLLVYIPGT